jgi:hypothetical protein
MRVRVRTASTALFNLLRSDVEVYHSVAELFGRVEDDIPLHKAIRSASRPGYDASQSDRSNYAIKFSYFSRLLHGIAVDTESGRPIIGPLDRVRLRPSGKCECGSKLYKRSPYGRTHPRCEACAAITGGEPADAEPEDGDGTAAAPVKRAAKPAVLGPAFEEWEERGLRAFARESGVQWELGDWWVAGEPLDYNRRVEFLQRGDLALHTVQNYASVCRKFPPSLRKEGLSFGHHNVVVAEPADEAQALLDWCLEGVAVDGYPRSIGKLRDERHQRQYKSDPFDPSAMKMADPPEQEPRKIPVLTAPSRSETSRTPLRLVASQSKTLNPREDATGAHAKRELVDLITKLSHLSLDEASRVVSGWFKNYAFDQAMQVLSPWLETLSPIERREFDRAVEPGADGAKSVH